MICTVSLTGKTDLHNYYPESWQRRDQQRPPRKHSTSFNARRSRPVIVAVCKVHQLIARHACEKVYLITLTTAPDYIGPRRMVGTPAPTIHQRRNTSLRLFVDRIRKEPLYRGHIWGAELHPGDGPNGDTVHYHIAVRMQSYWDYRNSVKRWSKRYCGSSNGLDISPPRSRSKAWWYFSRASHYALKGDVTLPTRTWSTSRIMRKWTEDISNLPLTSPPSSNGYRVRCGYVPRSHAISSSAAATMALFGKTNKRAYLYRARIKPPAQQRQ